MVMERSLRAFAWILKPLLVLGLVLIWGTGFAVAAPVPSLKQGERWVVVASTKNLNIAKGIAWHFYDLPVHVLQSSNGWLAVALGPFPARSVSDLAKLSKPIQGVPVDTVFSTGKNYTALLWSSPVAPFNDPLTPYEPGKPANLSSGSLSVTVQMNGTVDQPGSTIVTGTENDAQVFRFETNTDFAAFGAGAGLMKLDPDSEAPQLVFTRYSGGAHCCMQTWFVTKAKGAAGWSLIDGGILDGSGYGYEDKDGDGAMEIVSRDNRFLYAFGSYAGSFALTRVSQLRGSKLSDVTLDAQWRENLEQNLGWLEFYEKVPSDFSKTNSYLAAWVAVKSALGQGDEAWAVALRKQEPAPEFGPMECSTGEDITKCAPEKVVMVPFDRALAEFLSNTDYPIPSAGLALLKK
jgi:hypothetical protein